MKFSQQMTIRFKLEGRSLTMSDLLRKNLFKNLILYSHIFVPTSYELWITNHKSNFPLFSFCRLRQKQMWHCEKTPFLTGGHNGLFRNEKRQLVWKKVEKLRNCENCFFPLLFWPEIRVYLFVPVLFSFNSLVSCKQQHSNAGLSNVRPTGQTRPTKHLNVAC